MNWTAAFGFVTYVTYERKNAATLPGWPWSIVIIDTLWGITLCTLVALASHMIGQSLS